MIRQKVSDFWKYLLYTVTIYGVLFAAVVGIHTYRKEKEEREFEKSLVPVVIPPESLTPLSDYGLYTLSHKQPSGLEQKNRELRSIF